MTSPATYHTLSSVLPSVLATLLFLRELLLLRELLFLREVIDVELLAAAPLLK